MKVLGISAYYHNSAAALVEDGKIIAMAAEERFSRKKNDGGFPKNAIDYCLSEGGVSANELDEIVYYSEPEMVVNRFWNDLICSKDDAKTIINGSLDRIEKRLWIANEFEQIYHSLGKNNRFRVIRHHLSHAASAFYPSPFEDAIILTIDGVGEWDTLTIGQGKGNRIALYESIHYPHSLGMFYSALAWFCGFKVNSGEYKFMGLAPYGRPIYKDKIYNNLIKCNKDGSFELNLDYYDFYKGGEIINRAKFEKLFGVKKRDIDDDILQVYVDIAASTQAVIEEIVLKIVSFAKSKYGADIDSLVLAGGVALNCVLNGKIAESQIFKHIWIQPASDDAGGALGAALYVYYELTNAPRIASQSLMQGTFLGVKYSNKMIYDCLVKQEVPEELVFVDNEKTLAEIIAKYISQKKVVGLFQGRMEAGPRALGNRSILADPTSEDMQSILNLKIKKRESFRPFAPMIMEEYFDEYFEKASASDYSYMTFTTKINQNKRIDFSLPHMKNKRDKVDIIKLVNQVRSNVPAITHVDYSARVQVVRKEESPLVWNIINEFKQITGCPVIVNTSFNVRGEPIVCSPLDAYKCFRNTDMDVLVMGSYVIEKEQKK